MKKSLLLGLAALAFGVLPSCSNILEENGINPAAKAETGELRIALDADPSVSVTTKAGASKEVTLTDEQKKQFVITGKKTDNTSVDLGTFADYADGAAKTVDAGTYSITSTYGTMTGELAFDNPTFSGTTANDVVVTANVKATAEITATLTNSIISIDNETFTAFTNTATITDLFAYSGNTEPNGTEGKFSLLSADNTLKTEQELYVKAGASDANIVIKGTLKNDPTKSFSHTENIKTLIGKDQNIEEAKNYNIKYSLSGDKGSLTLTIIVNGTVKNVDLPVTVNPYQ